MLQTCVTGNRLHLSNTRYKAPCPPRVAASGQTTTRRLQDVDDGGVSSAFVHLKTYLNCLEAAAGSSAGCTLTVAAATKIRVASCTAALDSPCSCQRTFWGSDLAGNRACEPLKNYIKCLTDAGEADTCVAGVKASTLVLLPSARLETLTCNSGVSTLRMCSSIVAFLRFILLAFLR